MLILLDKDGTLVTPASGKKFVDHPLDQSLLPGVLDRLGELRGVAYPVIISNQGGVAAGHKSLRSAIEEIRCCMGLTGINDAYLCPDFEGLECYRITFRDGDFLDPERLTLPDFANCGEEIQPFRKPGAGMLQVARLYRSLEAGREIREVLMIGDRAEDQGAAVAAGVGFIDAEAWRSGAVSIAPGALVV